MHCKRKDVLSNPQILNSLNASPHSWFLQQKTQSKNKEQRPTRGEDNTRCETQIQRIKNAHPRRKSGMRDFFSPIVSSFMSCSSLVVLLFPIHLIFFPIHL